MLRKRVSSRSSAHKGDLVEAPEEGGGEVGLGCNSTVVSEPESDSSEERSGSSLLEQIF